MKALLSASDLEGIVELAQALVQAGFELVSTGGTGRHLADAGLPVTQVSDVTGFPEILDGRVKTLHPRLYGGILARRDLPDHQDQLALHGIDPIGFVVVNLYPFVETVSRAGVTLEDALDYIAKIWSSSPPRVLICGSLYLTGTALSADGFEMV